MQGGLVDCPGLQPPVNYVVRRAAALHRLPHRTQQPPLARRGEDEHLPELELVVPRVRLLRGRLHLHEYRGDPDPRERGGEEYDGQRGEDHEGWYPDRRRRDGEEDAEDYESDGEAQGHLEPAPVGWHHDVARAVGERLRLAGIHALEDHRQVVPAHAEIPDLLDGLVEPGPVVYYSYHGVPGVLLLYLPPFRQNANLQRRIRAHHALRFQPPNSIHCRVPAY